MGTDVQLPYERNGWSAFYKVPVRAVGHLTPDCLELKDIKAEFWTQCDPPAKARVPEFTEVLPTS